MLDAMSSSSALQPWNPFVTLKLRQLQRLGWRTEWLALRRWEVMSLEETLTGAPGP